MAKVKAFTFKNMAKATGLMALGNHIPNVTIKNEGKRVGWIDSPKAQSKTDDFSVYLCVKKEKTKEDPAPFKNVKLKMRTNTLEEMKVWLKANTESIMKHYDLYKTDMDE